MTQFVVYFSFIIYSSFSIIFTIQLDSLKLDSSSFTSGFFFFFFCFGSLVHSIDGKCFLKQIKIVLFVFLSLFPFFFSFSFFTKRIDKNASQSKRTTLRNTFDKIEKTQTGAKSTFKRIPSNLIEKAIKQRRPTERKRERRNPNNMHFEKKSKKNQNKYSIYSL